MSALHGVGLVAGREIREAVRRKAFWAVVGVLLLGSVAGMVIPELLADDGPTRYDVAVVDGTPALDTAVRSAVESLDAEVELHPEPTADAAARAVDRDDADVAVVAGVEPVVIVRSGEHDRLVGAVQQGLAVDSLSRRLEAAGASADDVAAALSAPAATVRELDADSAERRAASFAVSIVLYILLLSLMMQVANGAAVEKANRISEVLLAIVRPSALLFGKVLGVGLIGGLTLLAGIVPVVAKLALGGDLPEGLGPAVAGAGPWFVLGLLLFLTLAGALGALVERQEEAGTVVSPLMAILISTFVVVQSGADSPLGTVLAYVPFTSPLVEPARLAMGVSSPAEVVGSLAIGLVTLLFVVRLGGTIYGRAVVRTGRRLKLREVLQPARASA